MSNTKHLQRLWQTFFRFRFPLAIQYDNVSFADGLGAQALRLVGIYSIACKYRLNYIHKKIWIEHPDELLGPHLTKQSLASTMYQIEELLSLPTSTFSTKRPIKFINVRVLSRRLLVKLIFTSLFSKFFLIINLQLPQGITDRNPEILEYGAHLIRQNLKNLVGGRTRPDCVLHLRSGNRTVKTSRFNALPQLNSYYYQETLKKYRTYGSNLIIHTDFFPEDFSAVLTTYRLEAFKEFLDEAGSDESTSICHYSPIIETLFDMATTKTLIMANSALSYFAGLLNDSEVIWPPIHGHAKLNRWKTGNLLPIEKITFVDESDHALLNSPDHTTYKNRLE